MARGTEAFFQDNRRAMMSIGQAVAMAGPAVVSDQIFIPRIEHADLLGHIVHQRTGAIVVLVQGTHNRGEHDDYESRRTRNHTMGHSSVSYHPILPKRCLKKKTYSKIGPDAHRNERRQGVTITCPSGMSFQETVQQARWLCPFTLVH
jgi:hypothetical protein